jgi:hypothetical protein
VEGVTIAAPEAPRRTVFEPRTVAAVVVAGIVAFVLFLLLSAYAGELRPRGDARAHPLSNAAIGFRAIVRMIELGGGRAEMVRTPDGLVTEDLLVVTVEERTRPRELAELLERRRDLPTLVILPKWAVMADPARPGWVRRLGAAPPGNRLLEPIGGGRIDFTARATGEVGGKDFLADYRAPAPQQALTLSGDQLTPLLVAEGGGALLAQLGEAPHYILADPDLLNNLGMADERTARAALALLGALNSTGADTIAFDLTLNGIASAPSALKLAFEPPFLPLTLALFVAAVLAGLHGAVRFGAAEEEAPALAFGKSALVENSAALFKIARREHRAGGAYAELIREAAAVDSGAHLALRDAELDAYLDRVSPADGPPFSALGARARAAAGAADLVAAARALFQWKKDLIK